MEKRKFERSRQARWDRRYLKTVSCHLTTRQYDTLRIICEAEGTTPYKVIQDYLRHYIRSADARLFSPYGGR